MRKLVLVTAIALLSTSAYAGSSRGLVLASTVTQPAASPAAQAAPAAPTTQAAAPPQVPAKPDKGQVIFEQLVKHGVIKLPNQTTTAPAAPPAPVATAPVTIAPATTTAPAAAAPAPVAQPATVSSTPAPVVQSATPPVAAPAAAPTTAPVVKAAKVASENPKGMSRTESRIRAELRRHGIR